MEKGDAVHCRDVQTLKKKTSPPARFTEGTLIESMVNIHRFVADADAKAALKDAKGCGSRLQHGKVV